MSSSRSLLALVLALAFAVPTAWAAGPTPRQVAERRVLSSPRTFLRWGGRPASLVDPHTKLFRTNVTASCRRATSRGRAFVCAVRYGRTSVRVRYVPVGRRSWRLTRLPRR